MEANFNNNLSVVLVDYFCRNLVDPDPGEEVMEGADLDVFCLESLFPQFEEFMKKIDV